MTSSLALLHLLTSNSTCECKLYVMKIAQECLWISRVEFIPCNKQDMYVIEVHIKPGEKDEIYSDSDHKVCTLVTHDLQCRQCSVAQTYCFTLSVLIPNLYNFVVACQVL